MASLHKKGNRWYVVQMVNERPRWFSTGCTLDQKDRAEEVKRTIESRYNRNPWDLPTETPLSALVSDFILQRARVKSKSVLNNELSQLRNLFGVICQPLMPRKHGRANTHKPTVLACQTIEELGAVVMARRFDELHAGGMDATTVNKHRALLYTFWEWAIRTRGVKTPDSRAWNPVDLTPRYPESDSEIVYLKPDQIRHQLRTLGDTSSESIATARAAWNLKSTPDDEIAWRLTQFRAMAATAIFAGLRLSEVLWLSLDDCDLDVPRPRLHVAAKTDPRTGESWKPKHPKRMLRNRNVPISKALAAELRAYLPARAERVVSSPWMFPASEGGRWNKNNLGDLFRPLQRAHGLKWTFMEYRHTFGSMCARRGLSDVQIAHYMGNTPQMVRLHYASLRGDDEPRSPEFMEPV